MTQKAGQLRHMEMLDYQNRTLRRSPARLSTGQNRKVLGMTSTERCAFITGGLSGIGLLPRSCSPAAAFMLLASTRGYTCRKDAEAQLAAAAADVRWKSQQIDIRTTESINDGVTAIAADMGPVTILVNAAGTHVTTKPLPAIVMLNGKTRLPAI